MFSSPQTAAGHPIFGALFESAVVQEIRKQNDVLFAPASLFHWRSHGGAEVDLLLERDGKIFPIEIKGKSHPDSRDASGIQAFRRAYPQTQIDRGIIISLAENAYPLNDYDWVIPWDLVQSLKTIA